MKKLSLLLILIGTLCLVKSESSNFSKEAHRQKNVLNAKQENISISIVDENTLKDYENLVTLKLSDANVEEIRPGAFENNPKLKYIECDNNYLRKIKSGVFKNLKLTYLSLKDNNIKILEKGAFQNLSISGEFTLARNKIEEVRKEVFDHVNVDSIDLRRNSISKLEVGVFDKVKTPSGNLSLWLLSNKLEKIDANVFNHKDIILLNIGANQISELSASDLQNMPKLKFLRLSENKLTKLSEKVFSNNLHLFRLDLSRNQISTIESGAFDGLNVSSNLESYFDLSHNQLTKFDSNWFRNVFHGTGAIDLRFADNFIEEIPSQAFKNYPMVYLNLERNKIRNFAPDAFDGSKEIGILQLAGNSIENWNENILAGRTKNIFFLDLENNKLKCFEGDLDQIFASVNIVRLFRNPINATCVDKIRKCNKIVY